MKKIKAILLIMVVVTCCGVMSGCKKAYSCYSLRDEYVVCTTTTDTVRYYDEGYLDYQTRIKSYYENLGYTCNVVPYQMVGGYKQIKDVPREGVAYLETQGFTCQQNQ